MAESISLQQVLSTAPVDATPSAETYVVTVKNGDIQRLAYPSVKVDPALALYTDYGITPFITGSITEAGVFDSATQVRIDRLIALGIPAEMISVAVVEATSSITAAVSTITSAIESGLLVGNIVSADSITSIVGSIGSLFGVLSAEAATISFTAGGGTISTVDVLAAYDSIVGSLVESGSLVGVLVPSDALGSLISSEGSLSFGDQLTADTFIVSLFDSSASLIGVLAGDQAIINDNLDTSMLVGVLLPSDSTIYEASDLGVLVGTLAPNSSVLTSALDAGSVAAPIDTTAPIITAFTAGTPSGSTVPITTFTATDAVGVTGYLITESATPPAAGAAGWSGTAPTSYTAVGTGSVTLYAWAKDAAGNVSTAATQTVTIAAAPSGPFTMDFSTGAQGLTDSLGTEWSKVVPTDVGYGVVGSILSNQAGGFSGNCMVVTPSVYDDGDVNFDYMPTYITRTAVTINTGTITFRAKRTSTLIQAFISINGTVTSFPTTVGSWIQCSVNIPSTLSGAIIQIGVASSGVPDATTRTVSIDSLSVP